MGALAHRNGWNNQVDKTRGRVVGAEEGWREYDVHFEGQTSKQVSERQRESLCMYSERPVQECKKTRENLDTERVGWGEDMPRWRVRASSGSASESVSESLRSATGSCERTVEVRRLPWHHRGCCASLPAGGRPANRSEGRGLGLQQPRLDLAAPEGGHIQAGQRRRGGDGG